MSTDTASMMAGERAAPLELGLGMAFRTRPQSVLRSQRTSARLVGAVGRSSVGFGLAVGRSRAVHPVVRRVDLNSAALKPPTDFWRERVDDSGFEPEPSSRPTSATPAADGVVRRAPATPLRSSGQNPRTPRRRPSPARASWTDQILQRSSIGWTEKAALGVNQPPPPPPSAPPDDFVSSGDSRLDAMRLAMKAASTKAAPAQSGPTSSDRPSGRRTAGSESPTVRHRASAVDGDTAADETAPGDTAARVIDTTRGSTSAGDRTGPGAVARSWRPDAIDETPAARVARQARTSAPSTAARTPAPRRRGDRLDELRATLAARAAEKANESAPGSTLPDDPRPGSDGASRRTSQRAGDAVRRRPDTSPGSQPDPRPTGGRSRPSAPSSSTTAQRRAAVDETLRRIRTQNPDGGSTTPTTPARPRRDDTSGASDATTSPSSRLTTTQDRMYAPSDTGSTVAPPLTAASPAALRRIQRTLTSDGHPMDSSWTDTRSSSEPTRNAASRPPAGVGTVPDSTAGVSSVRPVGTIATDSRIDALAIPTLPVSPAAVQASGGAAATQLLRRVTLPRATSIGHRPTTSGTVALRRSASDTAAPPAIDHRTERQATGAAPTTASAAPTSAAGVPTAASARTLARRRHTPSSAAVAATGSEAARSELTSVEPELMPTRSDSGPTAHRRRSSVQSSDAVERSTSGPASLSRSDPRPNLLSSALRRVHDRPSPADPTVGRSIAGTSTSAASPTSRGIRTPVSTDGPPGSPAGRSVVSNPVGQLQTSASEVAQHDAVDRPSVEHNRALPTTSDALVHRFMDELSTTIQRRPDRLPASYRPMADAITGGRRVMFSTDSTSRRALRSVGKVAATTDDVIHLDTTKTPRRRLDEVIAHELTHVAHPSATPRFFDDVDHSPEERKAEQVAEIIARSPLAPNSPAASRPPTRSSPATPDTIRRTPADRSRSSSVGSIGAASLASGISGSTPGSSGAGSGGSISRSAGPNSSELLRRAIDSGAASGGSSSGPSNAGEQIQRRALPPAMTQSTVPDTTADTGSSNDDKRVFDLDDVPGAEDWFVEQLSRHFDRIVDQLEQRMIVEFERRGGRTWGGL